MANLSGLVLSGGGARTAFQVGVLKAISEWVSKSEIPFKVIVGTSAGSINAAYLAANADQFHRSVETMVNMWGNLKTKNVYYSDIISSNYPKTLFNLFNKIRLGLDQTNSILNELPLTKLLNDQSNFDRIQYCINKGFLKSLAITATNFQYSMSTTFVQSNDKTEWERVRRSGIYQKIKVKHLMASTAIPFLFSPVKISKQFYGDGSLRNFAPFSPAIRSGASNLIVIGTRSLKDPTIQNKKNISFGDIFSKILNTILFDSLDVDHERLLRINQTISSTENNTSGLKPIQSIIIRPTVDIQELVNDYTYECPSILKQLMRLIGSKNNGNDLKSYLLFEPGYLSALIDQGYKDAVSQKDEILEVMNNKKALE